VSMPSAEIEMVMARLDDIRKDNADMRKENSHEHESLHEKMNAMAVEGTAVSRQNHEIISKQADSIDRHERYINKQVGQVAGITIVTTVLIWVGKILLTKVL